MNFNEVFEALSNINESNSQEDVRNIFDAIGKHLGIIPTTIMSNQFPVYRARPINNIHEITQICDLSYCPHKEKIGFGRANINEQPMFYCASANTFQDGILACIVETLKQNEVEEQSIVISEWKLKEDLKLPIIDHENSCDINARNSCYDMSWLAKITLNKDEGYIRFYNYMAETFSNEAKHDYEYWITSYFAKKIIGNRFGGIIYDSVQTKRIGLEDVKCVAFTPSAVDEKLELKRAIYLKLNYSADNIKIIHFQEIDISTLK